MGGKDGRGEKPSASVGSQVSQRFIVYQSHYIMIIIIKIRVVNHGYATIKEIYVQRKQCHANKTNVHQRNMPPLIIRTAFCSRIDSSWVLGFCVFPDVVVLHRWSRAAPAPLLVGFHLEPMKRMISGTMDGWWDEVRIFADIFR